MLNPAARGVQKRLGTTMSRGENMPPAAVRACHPPEHDRLPADPSTWSRADRFRCVMNAHRAARVLAKTGGLVARYGELGATLLTDGTCEYNRPEVLSHLIRRSRETALRAIRRCRDAGLPCPAAVESFQFAELSREDADGVAVLTDYWDATLQARATEMLYEPRPGRAW